jgi:hypothetical protein
LPEREGLVLEGNSWDEDEGVVLWLKVRLAAEGRRLGSVW